MFPFDSNSSRRAINLGGSASSSTHASLISEARAIRQERDAARRRTQAAESIQAWARACRRRRAVHRDLVQELRKEVSEGRASDVKALRLLGLVNPGDPVVGEWAAALGGNSRKLRETRPILARRAMLIVLEAVVKDPSWTPGLTLLNECLSPDIAEYLIGHHLYKSVSNTISAIPVPSKKHPSLPGLVDLIIAPINFFPPEHPLFPRVVTDIIQNILSIPLLPNRLPITSLPNLAKHLPLTSLYLSQGIQLDSASAINVLANLMAFAPPRYPSFKSMQSQSGLLQILAGLLAYVPQGSLAPPPTQPSVIASATAEDSDSDSGDISRPATLSWTPKVDARTFKRIETLHSPAHLGSLLSFPRPALMAFVLSLAAVFVSRKSQIYGALLNAPRGNGIIREVWRESVRSSGLGDGATLNDLTGSSSMAAWPPILFLSEAYSQLLRTMGDDEFFGSAALPAHAQRNPLTLHELPYLARMLTYIAYTLHWNASTIVSSTVPGLPSTLAWADVVRAIGTCVTALHERDTRRSFMPTSGWIMDSFNDDGNAFIEAAVFEDQEEMPVRVGPPTARRLAQLTPRLAVLANIPFSIPFEIRVSIFRAFVLQDRIVRHNQPYRGPNRTRIIVRRGHVAEDGFDKLDGVDLKKPLEIVFIDQFGNEEAGIDGGGVFKEFFTSLCQEVFDTDRGLWLATKQNELYPNPHTYATESHSLNWYRFVGRILGKALYEGILVDVAFAGFFLAKWLGKQSILNDLASLDPELYQGLVFLKHYTGDPEELSLNFTVAVEEFGENKAIDLIPNGSNITVNRENRLRYILMVANYRLSKQIRLQSMAFFEGLSEMIEPKWLRMFDPQEVQILMGGVNQPPDLVDLREHTQYGGVYDDNHETIVAFWKVVDSFTYEQKRSLLRFVTSCSRPPLLGFKELVPNFAIRDAGTDQSRLPTSSTCVNLLKLPRYTDEGALRAKLLQAINSGAGFDLS